MTRKEKIDRFELEILRIIKANIKPPNASELEAVMESAKHICAIYYGFTFPLQDDEPKIFFSKPVGATLMIDGQQKQVVLSKCLVVKTEQEQLEMLEKFRMHNTEAG